MEPVTKIGGAKKDEVLKASAPTLKGLKVIGKINVESLKPKSSSSSSSDDKKKRRRTRKKVATKVVPGRRPGAGANRYKKNDRNKPKKDEVKEISKKEIDDKIKATMARLQGGSGKKKRQKQRRDVREKKRERQELVTAEKQDGKIHITEFITVSELASIFNVDISEVIMTCMNIGVIVSINQRLDAEIIEIIADEFEKEIEFITKYDIKSISYLDKTFPNRLSNCTDAPILLYQKGDTNLNQQKIISIVGTRKATHYGKAFVADLFFFFPSEIASSYL